MTNKPLSARARRALVALVLHPDATTNRTVHDEFGFKIESAERSELDGRELITFSRGPHNAFVHQLTDAGLQQCREELSAVAPDDAKPADRILFATWQLLARTLPDTLPALRSFLGMSPPSLPERILAVYQELAARPGGPVGLEKLREHLDAERKEVDRTLLEMDGRREIHLEPDPDRGGLTAEAREAAIHLAGRPMHLLRVRA
ncbi:hypothetical protein AB0F72_41945 [Actinoplanes sp. NPDC023936]|uniref:hypothetical protein n=1 Tax=Actinoplanes sp. NPDC023936 TaxID=3154910 RepID=UPI0033D5FEA2